MREEEKMKSALIRTLCALVFCIAVILLKFVFREEKIVEEIYNYLSSDIVFLR